MSTLFTALTNSFTGLNAAQRSIDVAARNVANAGTAGYTKKTLPIDNHVLGGSGRGVMTDAVQRDVDQRMMQQLRADTAAASRSSVIADFTGRIDQLFGRPQDESSIAAQIDRFSGALQGLATNPESATARAGVMNEAGATARQLNGLSEQVQGMRGEAEQAIDAAVNQVNDDLQAVARLNGQIAQRTATGESYADLADERDEHLRAVSEQIDVRVIDGDEGRSLVFTPDGNSLVGRGGARPLNFDRHFEINAQTTWSSDPDARGVGTLTLGSAGNTVDLIQAGSLTGGRIDGLVELRDEILPQAQAQMDEIAHQMATAVAGHSVTADTSTPGNAVLDAGALLADAGDRAEITINGTGSQTYTFVAADDPPANTPGATTRFFQLGATENATATNLKGAIDALSAGVTTSVAAGTGEITVSDGTASVTDMSAEITLTALSSDDPDRTGVPVFADNRAGQTAYTGAPGNGGQKTGYAARIAVNEALAASPERLVLMNDAGAPGGATPVGDPKRPMALAQRLAESPMTFSPSTGIGGATQPHRGTLAGFAREMVSFQGNQAALAESQAQEADAVQQAVQSRVDNATGVNIDEEMSRLMEMEKIYAANAKLMGTVDRMFDTLFAIKR